jgi:hypothetical protein
VNTAFHEARNVILGAFYENDKHIGFVKTQKIDNHPLQQQQA